MPSKAEIEAKMTPAGGYLRKDLESWGVKWPPKQGWKMRLIREHAEANGLPIPLMPQRRRPFDFRDADGNEHTLEVTLKKLDTARLILNDALVTGIEDPAAGMSEVADALQILETIR